ncbi:hypothetical protein CKO33_03815 [Ectothiorhodospira mobilis]|nr:hypothetical protein [Ectothiorhodospira mobilis]
MARRGRGMARRRQPRSPWWQRVSWGRLGRTLGGTGLLVALTGTVWTLSGYLDRVDTLPVERVTVEGELHHLPRGAVREVVSTHLPAGFFTLDLEAVRRDLQALPWIRTASVERVWPDGVRLHLDEQVPVARWGDTAVLNQYGETFRPEAGTLPPGLPALEGTPGRERVLMERLLAVQARLADVGLEVAGLTEDARRSWTVHLADGSRVLMGRGMDPARLDRLVRMYPRLRAHRETPIRRIDMRYANGIAVAWVPAGVEG